MSKITLGGEVLNRIAEVFRLSEEVSRVVIDIKCSDVPRVIICDMLTEEKAAVLVDALKACNAEVMR